MTQSLVSAWLLILLLAACAPQPAPATAPVPQAAPVVPAPAAPVARALAKQAWEVEWGITLEAAKKEGVVAFATSTGSEGRRSLSETPKAKYDIRVESMVGAAGAIMSKILAERRAGLYLWDVMVGGTSAHMTVFKPGGATSPLEPALILPDLTDPEIIKNVWYEGKLPWVDREHHVIGALLYVTMFLGVNTNLVKPEEMKSWDDLLNPKWRGKILLLDPTLPGTSCDGGMMPMFYEAKGEEWVRKLAAQEPVIVRDERLPLDWLAQGKYPIYIPVKAANFLEFVRAGAPVAQVVTEDVMALTGGFSGVSLIDKAPHLNSARVFINWYLSKEGQTIFSRAVTSQSARLDVPTDFLRPDEVRKPWWKYHLNVTEENFAKVVDYRKKSKEIFGHLIK